MKYVCNESRIVSFLRTKFTTIWNQSIHFSTSPFNTKKKNYLCVRCCSTRKMPSHHHHGTKCFDERECVCVIVCAHRLYITFVSPIYVPNSFYVFFLLLFLTSNGVWWQMIWSFNLFSKSKAHSYRWLRNLAFFFVATETQFNCFELMMKSKFYSNFPFLSIKYANDKDVLISVSWW